MTRHISPELESAVAERGTLTDKLLVALIETVNEQNAIHDELVNISRQLDQLGDLRDLGNLSRQLEGMSLTLSAIAGNTANRRW